MDTILPSEINLSIFSRLPVNSVLECRRVCKFWRNLLQFHHDTHFAYLHLRYHHGLVTNQKHHQPFNTNYDEISCRDGNSADLSFALFNGQSIYYAEYHEGEETQLLLHTTRINLNFPVDVRNYSVSSCNGLICLLDVTERNAAIIYPRCAKPLYICNPITREIVTIPGLDFHEKNENGIKPVRRFKLAHGFGYHPSTNKYKVVRICYHSRGEHDHDFFPGKVEVYTLGSGKGWRNIGQTDYCLVPYDNDETANSCVNGCLHWLKYKTEEIVAFDLADEEFHLVHKPPDLPYDSQSSSRIFVMNGCLCLAYEYEDYSVDLWMLKKNDKEENPGTDNQRSHAEHQYYNSWSWSKEFHIEPTCGGFGKIDKIVRLTEGDELLFFHSTGSISRYNPRTKTSETFWIENFTDDGLFDYRMISHAHSFVSLKAAGEVNVETCIGSTDNDDSEYSYY